MFRLGEMSDISPLFLGPYLDQPACNLEWKEVISRQGLETSAVLTAMRQDGIWGVSRYQVRPRQLMPDKTVNQWGILTV